MSAGVGPVEIINALGMNTTVYQLFMAYRKLLLIESIKPMHLAECQLAFYSGAMAIIEAYNWTVENASVSQNDGHRLMTKLWDELVEFGEWYAEGGPRDGRSPAAEARKISPPRLAKEA
jgi:hypothetical protein